MKKIDSRTYRLRKLLDYLGVICLVMLLILIWQLYRGSIAMPFLKPYIIKALNHDDAEYQVSLDSVNLELVRSIRGSFPDVPIIATGGSTPDTILATIDAGANAITYTPPSTQELFHAMMAKYRDGDACVN